MIYTYKDLLEKYKDDYNIKKALKNKEIFKIEKGLYSNDDLVDPLVTYSNKYPNSVITMDSAFFFYDLTDVIPNKVYLATASNSRAIKDVNVIQSYSDKDLLNLGKEYVIVNDKDGKAIMYDKERLLIELIRKRNQIPFDYYKEIILNYRKIADTLDMDKINEYLNHFKHDQKIYDIMMREVF